MENRIVLNEEEKILIKKLNHPVYTIEYIEQAGNFKGKVTDNAIKCLEAMGAIGYYQAVKQMVEFELYKQILRRENDGFKKVTKRRY